MRGQPPLAVAKFLLGRISGVEEPVHGAAELSQIGAGAALFEPGRPVVGVQDFERARTHLVDPPDQPKPEHTRDEQRDPEHQPADEQELFEERRRLSAVPGPLDQVETHEADHEQNDDDDARLQHAGTENSLTTARVKGLHRWGAESRPRCSQRCKLLRGSYCDGVVWDVGLMIRFSMKNSIIRSVLMPLWPRSGPTCTSKLFPDCCSAAMSCIIFDGCTLLSAVP